MAINGCCAGTSKSELTAAYIFSNLAGNTKGGLIRFNIVTFQQI